LNRPNELARIILILIVIHIFMNTTTDFTGLSVESAGVAVVAVSALGPEIDRQIVAASLDSSAEKGRSARIVLGHARNSRGIPELDSPMAG
jgi:hypothetical protein